MRSDSQSALNVADDEGCACCTPLRAVSSSCEIKFPSRSDSASTYCELCTSSSLLLTIARVPQLQIRTRPNDQHQSILAYTVRTVNISLLTSEAKAKLQPIKYALGAMSQRCAGEVAIDTQSVRMCCFVTQQLKLFAASIGQRHV